MLTHSRTQRQGTHLWSWRQGCSGISLCLILLCPEWCTSGARSRLHLQQGIEKYHAFLQPLQVFTASLSHIYRRAYRYMKTHERTHHTQPDSTTQGVSIRSCPNVADNLFLQTTWSASQSIVMRCGTSRLCTTWHGFFLWPRTSQIPLRLCKQFHRDTSKALGS